MKLSIILPTYNESSWLPKTITKLETAINQAKLLSQVEIIVIDDGSSDDTKEVIGELKKNTESSIVYIHQQNKGRFLARKIGIESAKYDTILFIDSRVYIDKGALEYVSKKISDTPKKKVWNAHVDVYKKGNIYARFWGAITFIAWRKYFANPRETSYGLDEFDYFPKGTTCFLAPKKLVEAAIKSFASSSKNSKRSNDDTLLIKYIVKRENIYISPEFSCTYHSRSTLKKFLNHAYHRGQVFVDGFLRLDGNRYFVPLIGFLMASIIVPILLIIFPSYAVLVVAATVIVWVGELLLALGLKVPSKDALSLTLLTPLFVLYYGAGIWTATLKRLG